MAEKLRMLDQLEAGPSRERSLNNAPRHPIAIRPEHVRDRETKLRIRQLDTIRDFAIETSEGSPLFTVEGKTWSGSQRREFRDASGLPLFELRRKLLRKQGAWYVHLPGGSEDDDVLTADLKGWITTRGNFDVHFQNAANPDENRDWRSDFKEATLEVRGQDSEHLTSHVLFKGMRVASVRRIPDGADLPPNQDGSFDTKARASASNARKDGIRRSEWEASAAANVDLTVVSR